MRMPILCMLMLSIGTLCAYAQQPSLSQLSARPLSFLTDYASSADKIVMRLRQKSEKALQKMKDTEKRIIKKLMKKDSAAAKAMASQLEGRYQHYNRLLTDSAAIDPLRNYYVAALDSAGVALKFLQGMGLSGSQQELANSIQSRLGLLQQNVTRTNLLQQALTDRVRELRSQLDGLPGLRELQKITKTVAYYKATLADYRALINQPDRMLAKMLTLLSETKLFRQLFERFSMLSSILPPSPSAVIDPTQSGSLQVRNAVMTAFGGAGNNINVLQTLQGQGGIAPNPFQELKDRILTLKKDRTLEEPTDKVPNNQRTKSFLHRLQVGTNFQTAKSNTYFPATTDLGLSVGFRINERSIIGVGGSYKLGWGKDFRHIRMTHEGVGLRTFINAKIKGSFSATGGYELNYQQPFDHLQSLPDMRTWRKSGLVGVTKTVDLKK